MKKIFYEYGTLRLVLVAFMVSSAFISCKDKGPANNPPATTISSTEYAENIKNKTGFIKSIIQNTTYEVHPGMEETHVKFENTSGSPLAFYFLTVDLSNPNISMEVATPNDKPDFARQTVKAQITHKNASLTGGYVIGAVNGDYWDINTPNIPAGTPLGPVIRKGVEIKEYPATPYYFLSILKSGNALMGSNAVYYSSLTNMQETLGGRYRLVEGGKDMTASLNTNVEPRTAVGLFNANKLVFMVVDGRRAGHSVGITMTGLAKVFMAIGVNQAINLDGGGSTTFITRSQTGVYETKNKPSDNAERSVANAWTIIGKNTP